MNITKTQSQKQSLNSKLQQIKQIFLKLLQNNPNQQNIRKQRNSTSSFHSHSKHYNAQYSKKTQLQKQNRIMAYQLKLLTNLIQLLQIDEDSYIYKLNKQKIDEQIKMKQINQQLQQMINKLQNQVVILKKQKEMMLKKIQSGDKNTKIYQKIMIQYQKIGGITKYNQLKDSLKQSNQKIQQLTKQIQINKQQINKHKRKCIILQQLNKQTQQKLCQAIIQNRNQNYTTKCSSGQKCYDKQKQNKNKINNSNQNSYKFQLMAAKQQIRQLKQRITNLEKQKDKQRLKYQQKQNIYEKLVMKSKIL